MRPPLVTADDKNWALLQCPSWARRGAIEGEEPFDDGAWIDAPRRDRREPPNWDLFVAEQIERFEKFFALERKSYADWSRLWRESWWPKANPERRFPNMAPKTPHPFFRKGSPEFARALKVATPAEQKMWERFNVAQFKPDDPRLDRVVLKKPLDHKMAAAGRDA